MRRSDTTSLLCRKMCDTCPFRAGSKYAMLRATLGGLAKSQGRICHSTGSNAINAQTGKKTAICRGARNLQLVMMHRLGQIDRPTDAAWAAARKKIGLKPEKLV